MIMKSGSVPVDVVRRDRDLYAVSFVPVVEGKLLLIDLHNLRTLTHNRYCSTVP